MTNSTTESGLRERPGSTERGAKLERAKASRRQRNSADQRARSTAEEPLIDYRDLLERTGYRDVLEILIRTVVAPAAWAARAGRFPRVGIEAFGRAGILGLTVAEDVGGQGHGLPEAVDVVQRVAASCPSTATVLARHFAATAVLEAHATHKVRQDIAAGRHLSTLAVADIDGDDLWSCVGRADVRGYTAQLRSHKRCVVAAGEADSYIWSTRALWADGGSTLWLVPGAAPGLHVPAETHTASPPGTSCADIVADPALVPSTATLGADGIGATILAETAMPWFYALSGAIDLGRSRP